MSKIKNDGLDQCVAEPFEQQQFGKAGVERVNRAMFSAFCTPVYDSQSWNTACRHIFERLLVAYTFRV